MAQCSLNVRVRHEPRTEARAARVEVAFSNIEDVIVAKLCSECRTALVAMAWLRSPAVLAAVPRGSRALVTNDARLPRYGSALSVRKIGRKRGARRPLMHNKFIVGLTEHGPAWVITGSFNATRHSTLNLENIVVLHDAALARAYASEFSAMWAIGRPC